MNGKIFDIQRFSIHDGPGIRTTVFMKGCNLRCKWCHNPEGATAEYNIMFYKHKCKGCGMCKEVCNNLFTNECVACGKCAIICPHSARVLCGREISADELLSEIKKDMKFYETSGGGVTFSGGEPLLQSEFVKEVLKKCKKEGIHTAIETAANVEWETMEDVLNYVDYLICDIKCIDEKLHIEGTGVSNVRILENVKKILELDRDVLFRMPLIMGYNEEEVEKVSEFIHGRKLELMPYHITGVGKYEALNLKYDGDKFSIPSKEFLDNVCNKYKNIFYDA